MIDLNNNNNNNNNNVLENDSFKLYWNRSILTDKTIPFNRPDITFINNKTKNTFLIDTAVPNTHNLIKTITDKQNKYQKLANEICAMWKQNTAQVIPLVISSTVVVPKSLPQSLKRQPASQYVHTNAKICNSWNMFNCQKIFKLQIRPPSLFLLITYPRIGECFPAEAEKFN
jgi:hypothetical protein